MFLHYFVFLPPFLDQIWFLCRAFNISAATVSVYCNRQFISSLSLSARTDKGTTSTTLSYGSVLLLMRKGHVLGRQAL
ncbi:unnamed protein product [Citrullus colocynthis]|uniref:Secreted protein n=1 Tax=Citrullus colocynthis TaxID=252529 RepID=A0ABP0Z316_9ROSI